ncbi:hypothetical protein L6452_09812 [Arctium lappa]|uniref:Uncharacterized protein n=1 Tax=Arctium lappa TaxID=4217 RepID=A0ACB9DLK2_ARCLA|nr:hypothetical protein L6452_09812 [Arctium lappa]
MDLCVFTLRDTGCVTYILFILYIYMWCIKTLYTQLKKMETKGREVNACEGCWVSDKVEFFWDQLTKRLGRSGH